MESVALLSAGTDGTGEKTAIEILAAFLCVFTPFQCLTQ